jgi:hypothetical protein
MLNLRHLNRHETFFILMNCIFDFCRRHAEMQQMKNADRRTLLFVVSLNCGTIGALNGVKTILDAR